LPISVSLHDTGGDRRPRDAAIAKSRAECAIAGSSNMTKFIIAAIVVLAVLVGGLLGLLRSRRAPMAPPDVLDRVKQRNRELEAQERREDQD